MDTDIVDSNKATTPLTEFVRPATAKLGFWRFVFGFLAIVVIWTLGGLISLFGFAFWYADDPSKISLAFEIIAEGRGKDSPIGLFALLSTFLSVWAGVWIVGKLVTKQKFGSFFSPDNGVGYRFFGQGLLIGIIFSAIGAVLFSFDMLRSSMEIDQWMKNLLPLVILVLIQATAEELVFRGYLLQQLAARYRSWIIWALIPSLVFGLLHFDPELPDYGGLYYVAATTMIGLVFCALVWRTGSLWMSAGLHVMVNIVAFTIVIPTQLSSGTEILLLDLPSMTPLFYIDIGTSVILLIFILSPVGKILGPGGRYEIPRDVS